MGDRRHLAVPSERDDKIGTQRLEHVVVVGEDRWVADLGGALGDKARVEILQADKFDVLHREEMTQIGGVVERVPVAHSDGGDANGHERSFLLLGAMCGE